MIEYREASPDDSAAIAALHADSWRRAYRGILRDEFLDGPIVQNRLEVWQQRLRERPGNQYVCLAIESGTLHGFGCVFGNADPNWGSMLDNLHVRAEASGHGIGTQLLGRTARWSLEKFRQSKFHLWVFAANLRARRFYEHLGATNSESVSITPPGGGTAVECRYTWSDVNALIQCTNS